MHPSTFRGKTNGAVRPAVSPDDRTCAKAIARIVHGRRVSDATRDALPDVWDDLATDAEDSRGLHADAKWDRLLKGDLIRDESPEDKRAILDELRQARKDAGEHDPEDEPDGTSGAAGFGLGVIDSATFFATAYTLCWHVMRVLVALQPCVIGGPKKALKTSLLIDMVVSMATATRFLGEFVVPRPLRVGFFSGESGHATIKDTALRVCRAKGLDPSELGNIVWGFRLPQLSQDEHLAELARVITEHRLEVVVIDPLYLCLLSGGGRRQDAGNLFDMGPLLSAVTETCLNAGATPILVHHFRKHRESPYDPPELEDLAFAGIQEFARQWVLIGRREKFEPGSGLHRLWLTVGGSAGHSGDYALDVDEGVMGDDFQGRQWGVTVKLAADAKAEATEDKQAAKAEEAAARLRLKDEARTKSVRDDAVTALTRLEELTRARGRGQTRTEWKEALLGWNSARFGPAVAFLAEHKMIADVTFTKVTSDGKHRDYDGFQSAQSLSRTEPDLSRTLHEGLAQTRSKSEPDSLGASSPEGGSPKKESGSDDGSTPNHDAIPKGLSRTLKSPAQGPPKAIGGRP